MRSSDFSEIGSSDVRSHYSTSSSTNGHPVSGLSSGGASATSHSPPQADEPSAAAAPPPPLDDPHRVL